MMRLYLSSSEINEDIENSINLENVCSFLSAIVLVVKNFSNFEFWSFSGAELVKS